MIESKYTELTTPWTRRWRCTLCSQTYRFDLSAEDGGPKELFAGHCNACTRGLMTVMRSFGMVSGSIMGMSYGMLEWEYSGKGVTCIPANKYSLSYVEIGMKAQFASKAKAEVIAAKTKQRKTKIKKATKKKQEVDDFMKLAGL